MTGQQLPRHDLDAENVVLSASMLDAHACGVAVSAIPTPDVYYSPTNRRIWGAIVRLTERGQPIDAATVAAELKRSGEAAPSGDGWTKALLSLIDAAPSVENVRAYCRTIVEAWEQRCVVELVRRIAAEGMGDVGDHRAWLTSVEERIFGATFRGAAARETLQHGGQVLREILQRMVDGKPPGLVVRSGLTTLDAELTMAVGDLGIVAARPGKGKTSLVMQVAVNVAMASVPDDAEEAPAALAFSAEMPNVQLMGRALCTRAGYSFREFRRGHIPAAQSETYQRIAAAAADFHAMPLWVDDRSKPTIGHIRAKIRQVKRELAKHWALSDDRPTRLRVVALDYIQIAGMTSRKDGSRVYEIGDFTSALKQLAKDEDVVVIALSQLKRIGEDEEPELEHLRESGSIEQDADWVLGIHRPEDETIAKIKGLKQRNGPEFVAKLAWDGPTTSFRDMSEREVQAEHRREQDAALTRSNGRRSRWAPKGNPHSRGGEA